MNQVSIIVLRIIKDKEEISNMKKMENLIQKIEYLEKKLLEERTIRLKLQDEVYVKNAAIDDLKLQLEEKVIRIRDNRITYLKIYIWIRRK